jgi:hypothetical protein
MSINGVSASTLNGDRTASSDGVDDFGLADGPQDLPENETFGIALVVQGTDRSNTSFFEISEFGVIDANAFDSSNGEILFQVDDSNNNFLSVESDEVVLDSQLHLIVINKLSNSGNDAVNMYIDSMASPSSSTVQRDQGFDNENYNATDSMGFFSRNDSGSASKHKALDLPFIEFNERPYSKQDRLGLKQRATGL